MSVTITNKTSYSIPSRNTIISLIHKIVSPTYHINIIFIGTKRATTLNTQYRGKKYPANILTFCIDNKEGDIYITAPLLQRDAKKWGISVREYILFLIIHGALYVKGVKNKKEHQRQERSYFAKLVSPIPLP